MEKKFQILGKEVTNKIVGGAFDKDNRRLRIRRRIRKKVGGTSEMPRS